MFKISILPEEIEKLPSGAFPGEIHIIEKPGLEYAKAIAYLMSQKVIGFDTETRPVFAANMPHHDVALLQLSGPDKAYLFRVNKLGMRKLMCSVLSNPDIIDLQKIASEWGVRDKSVKKMSAIILGCRISKTQQLSNWEAEDLSRSQQLYAATDAWICREMYLKLLSSEKHPLSPEELNPPTQNKQCNDQSHS